MFFPNLPPGSDTVEADGGGGAFGPSSGSFTETVITDPRVVTTTADNTTAPPPGGTGMLSLREAINLANQASGKQTISFNPTVFAKLRNADPA